MLENILSMSSDYLNATFYQKCFYYRPATSRNLPSIKAHIQSQKADKYQQIAAPEIEYLFSC